MNRYGRLILVCVAGALLAGCELPRYKGGEAYQSAVTPNPAPTAPVDPYSYGGIAEGSGGRSTETSYGAGAPGINEGAAEIYGLRTPAMANKELANSKAELYLTPDPETLDKLTRYLADEYDPPENSGYPFTTFRF